MYFKQIELIGFKSFAERTVVRLEPGTTAVVGPNGCGKSNILDALRWVLGEQSARELRGAHMQDVIFNGSDARHPLGMAEVSVVFDNSDSRLPVDFSEVQVTRRVYRSGESEYLLNMAPCRLRDIHELFMDTGIGTHAYSMIGQGKMDLILSSKPEDRRFIFEEAAGIIKYKTRKRVAMRKLESAEQNMLRLNDIIAEVQRQMRSLKRQVNAAIRYRELSAQLRELEIRSIFCKYVRLTEEVKQLQTAYAAGQNAFESANAEMSRLEARFEELGLEKLEVDRVLLARREAVHGLDTDMDRIERQIALLRQQIEFSQEQQQQCRQELASFGERAERILKQIETTRARLAELEAELAAGNSALEGKQQDHGRDTRRVAEADAHLEAVRVRTVEWMNQRTRTLAELETIGAALSNLETQLQGIHERQAGDDRKQQALVESLDSIRQLQEGQRSQIAETERHISAARAELTENSEGVRRIEDAIQGLRERKTSLEARVTSLRELRDTYEGFAAGVRAVMRARQEQPDTLPGILGPAGDLLSTDKRFERAIEAALGGNINNIIAENAEAAQAAIEFLKQHMAGRVTFLPLDLIHSSGADESRLLEHVKGVIGRAIDFVRYDAPLQKAVEYLLHNTVIVETLDDVLGVVRKLPRFPRLVTLEGEVLSSLGALTGGRTRHESRGLLGRRTEIDELEREAQGVESQLQARTGERQAQFESRNALNARLDEWAEQIAAVQRELAGLDVERTRQTTELENLTRALQERVDRRDELCTQREELEVQRRQATARVEHLESDDEALQGEVAAAQEAAARARQALSVCAQDLGDLRVQTAQVSHQQEEAQRDAERERLLYDEAVQEKQRRTELLEQLRQNQARLEAEMKAAVEQTRALSDSREKARQQVVEAENTRQRLLDESESLEKSLREVRERVREAQSEVHRLELVLRQNEDRIGFFQERILAEYHLALASLTADEVGGDEYDDDTREQLVTERRNQLQRLGEVNLMAIEEYEALEQRNAFLVAQAEDLQKARETLLGVIARSDKRIREMFMETFHAVGENFRVFFRQLFNGGQARIYLLDEDDPLESGIEIEARPPGKKPQSISLLSGGESAMTAIALLFSIFKARPSPFCILDEVDAPLDDANIGRFLSLLEEFTADSQFIVITHNKQTMSRADALYGVTMQERGVSQIVSVKFSERNAAESAA
ncbi:MAG: chromosome segregation protein SMC [Candidatus Hydrogenedentes bacterium]|nr:chromosome segregation protein SMC [Candidatus Hydrogenedentota bacterium]